MDMNPGVANCINLLDVGQPIVIGFKCFPSIGQAEKSGLIPIPQKNEVCIGNHAVTVVGYSIEQRVFKFMNSWGDEWGDKGFGYLPFYFFETGLVLEMYTINIQER